MNSNYFQIFSIEPNLKIDADALRKTLHELARKYHPDFRQGETDNEDCTLAGINVAYEVLRDFKKRLAYLLFLYRGKECKMEVAPDFLLEMLELNERIQDWQTEPNAGEREALLALLTEKFADLQEEYQELWASFHLDSCSEEEVRSLESYLARQQYLERLQNKLNQGEEYV